MTYDEVLKLQSSDIITLSDDIPFIWPEARVLAEQAIYKTVPPFAQLIDDADLISGVLVGAAIGTIRWIESLMQRKGKCTVRLVLVVYPAGPTRQDHLSKLLQIQSSQNGTDHELEFKILPTSSIYGREFIRMALLPTAIQAYKSKENKTIFCIGSIGDTGNDKAGPASFNAVFHPDDALRDSWRRWFQYVFSSAFPLTEESINIPYLVPPEGDPEADRMWEEFEKTCRIINAENMTKPTVDPETGEVTHDPEGVPVTVWDDGQTKLEPLAQMFQQVYAHGCLVTVDESTRIKPLRIPVKATLLGQQSERNVGAVWQKQSFGLQVLDDAAEKAIEKFRVVKDLVDVLTYPLSLGNRWLPEKAKALFEQELENKNKKGMEALKEALGEDDVEHFIQKRSASIRADLNEMYKQLGQGNSVPDYKFKVVIDEIKSRLSGALQDRITPRAVYNQIAPPDLTCNAPDENWAQPLLLLLSASRLLRKYFTDRFFAHKLSPWTFDEDDFLNAMDVFGDKILKERESRKKSKEELEELDKIEKDSEKSNKEKCVDVGEIILGKGNN